MPTVQIDFAKICALGDYIRYADGTFAGSEMTRHDERIRLVSGWLNEILGKDFGLQIYDLPAIRSIPEVISARRNEDSIFEVFGDEWAVIFRPKIYSWPWRTVIAFENGDDCATVFQGKFAYIDGFTRNGLITRSDFAFIGNYSAYEHDMTIFMMFHDRAKESLVRTAHQIENKTNNIEYAVEMAG